MVKKILLFFPHNPYPHRSGAHRRCLETFAALRQLGHEVLFVSATVSSETSWCQSSIDSLVQKYVNEVKVYEQTAEDQGYVRLLGNFYRLSKNRERGLRSLNADGDRGQRRVNGLAERAIPEFAIKAYVGAASVLDDERFRSLLRRADWQVINVLDRLCRVAGTVRAPVNSMMYTPPGFRRWFRRLIVERTPDVLFMNYSHWDNLVDHRALSSIVRIIDYHDPVSLSMAMQERLGQYLSSSTCGNQINERIVSEDFFEALGLQISDDEVQLFDQYTYTLALNRKEADYIRSKVANTAVRDISVTIEPAFIENDYSGPALFQVGPNRFNLQGYLYFAHRVLPRVLGKNPSFRLQITGFFGPETPSDSVEGIDLLGFVPDLTDVYRQSRFAVCPVLGGTGQQIKIVEAMAHGLPVIATRFSASSSPIQHEVNGLVAQDAAEFADHVLRLWNDPKLCRRLGAAARETIATNFSPAHLTRALNSVLEHRGSESTEGILN